MTSIDTQSAIETIQRLKPDWERGSASNFNKQFNFSKNTDDGEIKGTISLSVHNPKSQSKYPNKEGYWVEEYTYIALQVSMNNRQLFSVGAKQEEHAYSGRWFRAERTEYIETEGFALLLKFCETIDAALEKKRIAKKAAEDKEAEELRDNFFSKYR